MLPRIFDERQRFYVHGQQVRLSVLSWPSGGAERIGAISMTRRTSHGAQSRKAISHEGRAAADCRRDDEARRVGVASGASCSAYLIASIPDSASVVISSIKSNSNLAAASSDPCDVN